MKRKQLTQTIKIKSNDYSNEKLSQKTKQVKISNGIRKVASARVNLDLNLNYWYIFQVF